MCSIWHPAPAAIATACHVFVCFFYLRKEEPCIIARMLLCQSNLMFVVQDATNSGSQPSSQLVSESGGSSRGLPVSDGESSVWSISTVSTWVLQNWISNPSHDTCRMVLMVRFACRGKRGTVRMNSTEYRYVRTPDMSLELALLWESIPISSVQVQEKILKSESSIKCVCVCASARESPRTQDEVCKCKCKRGS